MDKAQLMECVIAHDIAFIHLSCHAHDAPLAGVLPDNIVALIVQHRRLISIHRNHQLIIIQLTQQMLVIEITEGVYKRLLVIFLLQ